MTTFEPCKAELHIGDDFADNRATMRCQREKGHDGPHHEEWLPCVAKSQEMHGATVEWWHDDTEAR